MKTIVDFSKVTREDKTIFLLSLAVASFWIIGNLVNVYHFAVVGAVFELLWLGVVTLTLLLPVMAFTRWVKEKFSLKTLSLYSILVVVITIAILIITYKTPV
ncbi:hypothetical protein [Hufsiella ginkgonis]|uniref:Uncharacterized protein n=1 Tax=Hufsiella ginkgonis TaxID=2695274 RepID=A0A7K1XWY5_9SPHI|nr:hypothetical protein [Hufsiella ginkgonis]MXV15337.1 hypothetical protein [Hufsiella ginkgonis]